MTTPNEATTLVSEVKALTPAEVKDSPAMLTEFTNTVTIVNDHLRDGKREVNLGSKLAAQTVKGVVKAFQVSKWSVRKKVDKSTRDVTLHLAAKREKSATPRKKGVKKNAPPAAAPPN